MRNLAIISKMSRAYRAPRKPQKLLPVFETLTSHDGTPCNIAWTQTTLVHNRPPASLQIYDTTTPTAENGVRKARLLFEGPMKESGEMYFRERLDIYGLAVESDVSEEERIMRCIAHQRAEIADREAGGRLDLHMMCWHWGTYVYKRFIIVIDKDAPDWQEGDMLFVWFDLVKKPEYVDWDLPDMRVKRFKGLEELRRQLSWVRSSFSFQSALDQGEFDDEYSRQNLSNWGPEDT